MCKPIVKEIREKNNYDLDYLRSAAKKLFEAYEHKTPVPIVQIVTDAGFSIFAQDLPENIRGYIILSNEVKEDFGNDKVIVCNQHESFYRRRFTVAHEFGHFLFDPAAKNFAEYYDAFESDDHDSEIERTVNRFAAELLMPKDIFEERYNQLKEQYTTKYDICQSLSEYFAVPVTAVEKRFEEIEVVEG